MGWSHARTVFHAASAVNAERHSQSASSFRHGRAICLDLNCS